MSSNYIKEIVSGGQTGVDRAALDAAIQFKIPHSGWCPFGRKAEDSVIEEKYNLKEAPAPSSEEKNDPDAIYKIRTELNAKDSDGTLIILNDSPIGGTLYTIDMAKKHQKPYLLFNIKKQFDINDVVKWIIKNKIHKLNIAGPRASQTSNIYQSAYDVIQQLLNHQLLNQNKHGASNNEIVWAKL